MNCQSRRRYSHACLSGKPVGDDEASASDPTLSTRLVGLRRSLVRLIE